MITNSINIKLYILFISLSICYSLLYSFQQKRFSKLFCISSNQNLQEKIFIYDTATRKKSLFVPLNPSKVSFYSCGPTVYDYAHIGNFRAFLTYDLLKRWLMYCGYNVEHICNLTDVDDKIIIKMKEESKSLHEITNKYSNAFFEDLEVLNIIKANNYPKATDYINEMTMMIDKLMNTGYAYSKRGSVYYRVSSFPRYGIFANMKFEDNLEGAGGSGPNEKRGLDDKESSRDFALWKSYDETEGDNVFWDTKFGRGRPGWHIECSAMCCNLLGDTIDIHGGGIDLVFPHHQNEIAQTEAFTGKPFSRYWIHNGFVNVDNEKMSKSLKNFKTLRQIANLPIEARAFRYLVMTSQYRNPLNFSPDTLKAAINSLKRIDKLLAGLQQVIDENQSGSEVDDNMKQSIMNAIQNFEESMCDDMNTPKAAAAMFQIINEAEKAMKQSKLSSSMALLVKESLYQIDKVFGLFYSPSPDYFKNESASTFSQQEDKLLQPDEIPHNIISLAKRRIELKSMKQYQEADSLRNEILGLGYIIKDRKDGNFDVFQKLN